MSECFVTLDKYKNDLSRQFSRDKLLIECLEREIGKIEFDCTSQSSEKVVLLRNIISWLKLPLDFWFTAQEWSEPLGFVSHGPRVKYQSIADGVQTHFEFEGER